MEENQKEILADIERQARKNRVRSLLAVGSLGIAGIVISFMYAYSANQVAELTDKYESLEAQQLQALEKVDSANRQFDLLQSHVRSLVGQLEDARTRQELLENRLLGEIHNLEARIGSTQTQGSGTAESEVRPSTALTGWVYLGQYDYDKNEWISANFSHGKRSAPEKLLNRTVSLAIDGLNVRNDAFFGKVIGALVKGDDVTVKKVSRYTGGSYIWGLITHNKT